MLKYVQVPVAEDSDEPESLRIRGFKMQTDHGLLIDVTSGDVSMDAEEDEDATITYSPKPRRSPWLVNRRQS
jgi:hypothetical protein